MTDQDTITIPKPPPGQVTLVICGEDGAKAWVSCSRDVLAMEGTVEQLLPCLDDAQERLRAKAAGEFAANEILHTNFRNGAAYTLTPPTTSTT